MRHGLPIHRRSAACPRAGRRRRLADHGEVQGARPARDDEARPDAGDRRRHLRGGRHPAHPVPGPPARRRARRGERRHRPLAAAVGDRPDRRHQELRPRRTRLGDPDRADGRRRGRGRCGDRTTAQPPLVGVGRRRRLDRQVAAPRGPLPGLRRLPPRGRLAVVLLDGRLGRARPARRLPVPRPALLAHPGVRRLLVLHAARGRCGRHRRRAGARAARHGRPRRDRARGRAACSPRSRARPAPTAATRWPATGGCTTRRSRSSARCPTTPATWPGAAPGSVHELSARRRPAGDDVD